MGNLNMEKAGKTLTEDLNVVLEISAEGFHITTSRFVEDKHMAVLLKAIAITLQEKHE